MTSEGDQVPWERRGLRGTVREAPPMFRLLLGETTGRDCALVYGVSDRTPSCWGSRGWDWLLRDGGAGGGPSEFASAWARRGGFDDRSPGMFGRRYRS